MTDSCKTCATKQMYRSEGRRRKGGTSFRARRHMQSSVRRGHLSSQAQGQQGLCPLVTRKRTEPVSRVEKGSKYQNYKSK